MLHLFVHTTPALSLKTKTFEKAADPIFPIYPIFVWKLWDCILVWRAETETVEYDLCLMFYWKCTSVDVAWSKGSQTPNKGKIWG